MAYQVIANRYRPTTFADVVGQDAIVKALLRALESGRLCHAYLLAGVRGTGKTTLARLLAKGANCLQKSASGEPCGRCHSCVEVAKGASIDVVEMDAASHRGIDDIRKLIEGSIYAPTHSPYTVYIIDEVHMLTKEAFNALLKTLEAPPPHLLFILATTEPHRIPDTILSRCQRFDLRRIAAKEIAGKLIAILNEQGVEYEKEAIELLVQRADGSMRDAESLLERALGTLSPPLTQEGIHQLLGLPPTSFFLRLDQGIQHRNLSLAFQLSEEVVSGGGHLPHFLQGLAEHYRARLMAALGLSEGSVKDQEAAEELLVIFQDLMACIEKVPQQPLTPLHLERILLNILTVKDRPSLAALVRKVEALQNQERGESPLLQSFAPCASKRGKEEDCLNEQPASKGEKEEVVLPEPYDTKRAEGLLEFAAVVLKGSRKRGE